MTRALPSQFPPIPSVFISRWQTSMFGNISCPANSACCRPACAPIAFSASTKRIGMRTILAPSKFPPASGSSSATIGAIPSIRVTSVLSIGKNAWEQFYKGSFLRQQRIHLIIELLLLLLIMLPRPRPAKPRMDLFDLTLLIHQARRWKIDDIIQLDQRLRRLLRIGHRNSCDQHRIFNVERPLEQTDRFGRPVKIRTTLIRQRNDLHALTRVFVVKLA